MIIKSSANDGAKEPSTARATSISKQVAPYTAVRNCLTSSDNQTELISVLISIMHMTEISRLLGASMAIDDRHIQKSVQL